MEQKLLRTMGKNLPEGTGGAMNILKLAMAEVHALKYALGIAGVAAVAAIVRLLLIDWRVAFVSVIVILFLMVILFLVSNVAAMKGAAVKLPLLVFIWSSLVFMIATGGLLSTSIFFNWPMNLQHWLTSVNDSKEEYNAYVSSTHESNISMIQKAITRDPSKNGTIKDIKEQLDRDKEELVYNTTRDRPMLAALIRARYNHAIAQLKQIDPSISFRRVLELNEYPNHRLSPVLSGTCQTCYRVTV